MNIDPATLWSITGVVALLSGIIYTAIYIRLDKIKGIGYLAIFAFLYACGVALNSFSVFSGNIGFIFLSDVFLISAIMAIYLAVREFSDKKPLSWMILGAIWVATVCSAYYVTTIAQDHTYKVVLFGLYTVSVFGMASYHLYSKVKLSSLGRLSLFVLLVYTTLFLAIKFISQYTYDIHSGSDAYNSWFISTNLIFLINLIWLMFSATFILAEKYQMELAERGYTDHITGLLNQKGIEEAAHRIIKRNQRTKTPVSLLMIDVDFFKEMNDVYGYDFSNHVLKSVGNLIKDTLRVEDYSCRYQADVFIVVIEGASLDEILLPSQRILNALSEEDLNIDGTLVPCTVSIGVAASVGDKDFYDLVEQAHEALMNVKSQGGNGIERSISNS